MPLIAERELRERRVRPKAVEPDTSAWQCRATPHDLKTGTCHEADASIGAPPSVGVQLLPSILEAFYQRHPNLELVLREGLTAAMNRYNVPEKAADPLDPHPPAPSPTAAGEGAPRHRRE